MIDWSKVTADEIIDPWWRLTNLYFIQNKQGERVKFDPWPEQIDLYHNMWYLNLVLKARQRGLTTFIQLFMLDACLFRRDTSAGIIAHTAGDASIFFSNKIKFAYDNLPGELKETLKADRSNTKELAFSNGSRISVSTSHRSGTLQYLHISEYGKLCAQYPEKAAEVRAGALNTVAPGNFIFIESTAEGRQGHFFDLCQESMHLRDSSVNLTPMDWKFHFYPWFGAKEYAMLDRVDIPVGMADYFEQLESEDNITLTGPQKYWYIKKSAEQGDAMKPEYPSTPAEAFEKLLRGAIFATQLKNARVDKRICKVPHLRGEPVDVFWDLGFNDINAMWMHQKAGPWDHFIYYHEDRLVDLTHYIEVLHDLAKEKGYQWGTMYLPHDGKQHHITALAGSASDILRRNGFKVRVVERPLRKVPSIEAARKKLNTCRFDAVGCDQGLKHLENYQWVWDAQGETYRKMPKHNAASNGADAFQTFGWWYRLKGNASFSNQQNQYGNNHGDFDYGGYSRKKKKKKTDYDHIL